MLFIRISKSKEPFLGTLNSVTIVVIVSGILSSLLAIYSGIPYIRSILNGRTKPHQFSFLVFGIMNGIVTLSQLLEGGSWSVLISAAYFFYCIVDYVLALKFGVKDTSRYDRLLLALSLITIVIWILTKSNSAAIWLTVLIDIFATTMIILKIKHDSFSEHPGPWIIATSAFAFSCVSLATTPIGVLYIRPIYGLLSDFIIVAAIFWFRARYKAQEEDRKPIDRQRIAFEDSSSYPS